MLGTSETRNRTCLRVILAKCVEAVEFIHKLLTSHLLRAASAHGLSINPPWKKKNPIGKKNKRASVASEKPTFVLTESNGV